MGLVLRMGRRTSHNGKAEVNACLDESVLPHSVHNENDDNVGKDHLPTDLLALFFRHQACDHHEELGHDQRHNNDDCMG